MNIAIIANPAAGRRRALRRLEKHLADCARADWEFEVYRTRCAGHAGVIALELLSRPPDVLAVCGGDGTVNEVVTRLPDPPFPVAVLPAGTANVLARVLELPLDPVRALQHALARRWRKADVGVLEARETRRFLLMCGIGFDASVILRCRSRLKQVMGIGAYYEAVLRSVLTYPFPEFVVSTEEETFTATSCIIANAEGYGGGVVLTPGASMWDGTLDILVLEKASRLDYVRFLIAARWRSGRPSPFPGVHRLRSRIIGVDGPRGVWVHVDGELAATLPLKVSVVPASFPLIGRESA